MRRFAIATIAGILSLAMVACTFAQAPVPGFRPPAVPLLVSDPFFSLWSSGDNLYDVDVARWTGRKLPMVGMVYVDGDCFRYMGSAQSVPECPNTVTQNRVTVAPTETLYEFTTGVCKLNVSFVTPQYPTSLEAVSLPYSLVTFKVACSKQSQVSIYFDINAEIVSTDDPEAIIESQSTQGLFETTLSFGKRRQYPLNSTKDELDWGNVHVAFQTKPNDPSNLKTSFAPLAGARQAFANSGSCPTVHATLKDEPLLVGRGVSLWFTLTNSTETQKVIALGLEEKHSINWFGSELIPYHLKVYGEFVPGLVGFLRKSSDVYNNASQFNTEFFDKVGKQMGSQAATLLALSYRQVLGASKVALDPISKRVYFFLKDMSAGGRLNAVDVIYPAAPFFLHYNETLLLKLLEPVLDYARGNVPSNFKETFSPSHVGVYPLGFSVPQKKELALEETANMVLLLAAYTKASNDVAFWKGNSYAMITFMDEWVKYLVNNLPMPKGQSTTDDLLRPSTNNTNLASRGILAIRAYAWLNFHLQLLEVRYKYYLRLSQDYREVWSELSKTSRCDHPHWSLQYNESDTWSLKYNFLFDDLLGLDFISDNDRQNELSFYFFEKAKKYALPLDSRDILAKLDWQFWVAASSQDPHQRQEIYRRTYKYAHETPSRVPLSDLYDAVSSKTRAPIHQSGFYVARPVVGALWAPLLRPLA